MVPWLSVIAYTREKFLKLIKIEFVRFCIVGGLGFCINFALLATLHNLLHVNIFLSQLVAAEIALFSNFLLHHHWTYVSHHVIKSKGWLLVQFHASSWPAIIGSSVMVGLGVELLHLNDLMALILSSAIALGWNFAWSKYVVWKDVSKRQATHIVE